MNLQRTSSTFVEMDHTICDPIHSVMDFIDTRQFQRLRKLRQLGCSYYVFPGASHHRFEHSIGVAHLAGELVKKIKNRQPELEINNNDIYMLQLAGLSHDLGPFSHVWDGVFLPTILKNHAPRHEDLSEMMLDYLVDENNIDLSSKQLTYIKSLINPYQKDIRNDCEKVFLYDIVANTRNSLDVDKFDYLIRDCHNIGITSGCQPESIMNSCKVIDEEICYDSRVVYKIYQVFQCRYSLFREVYTHPTIKAIEYMINDALIEANSEEMYVEKVKKAEDYQYLTDDIVTDIEKSKSDSMCIKNAKNILNRLHKRQLYKMVYEIIVPSNQWSKVAQVKEIDIINCQKGSNLRPNDIIVHKLCINFAMKAQNPVDHIRFFKNWSDSTSFTIPATKVSQLIPSQFQEHRLRLFVRTPSSSVISAAKTAFRNFLRRHKLDEYKTGAQNNEDFNINSTINENTFTPTPSDSPCPSPRIRKRFKPSKAAINLFE